MVVDPSFIQKLWNKGVDIAAAVVASTISAAIIAGIATLTWKYKRRRDLHLEEAKQRQQYRIAGEMKAEDQRAERREYIKRLGRELDDFVRAMAGATDGERIDDVWYRYGLWLEQNEITLLPGNQRVLSNVGNVSRSIDRSAEAVAKDISEQVRLTELPTE